MSTISGADICQVETSQSAAEIRLHCLAMQQPLELVFHLIRLSSLSLHSCSAAPADTKNGENATQMVTLTDAGFNTAARTLRSVLGLLSWERSSHS